MTEIPKGYKQTDVGVIPEDWEVTTVGAEFSIQLGKMLDSEKNVGAAKPFLGNRAVQWGRVDLSDIGVIKLTPSDIQRFRLRVGDLLVCEGGEIGRAAIWQQPIAECYYQKALHRLRPKRGYNVKLLRNVLQRLATTGFLLNFVTQTSIAHLPKDKFETVPIPLPPTKAEQEAIAEALSDADALIESLEQLIAKKRQLKQGAMQELLRPKPSDDVQLLREVSTLKGRIGWQGLNQTEFTTNEDEPFLITGMNFKDGAIRWDEVYHISEERYEIAKDIQLRMGDVLMTKDGTIGKILYIDEIPYPGKASLNSHLLLFRPIRDSYHPRYLYYQLSSQRFKDFIELSKSGTTFFGLSQAAVGNYPALLPIKEEQVRIAAILSDMDVEIAALETKLSKARNIKQGMMQELLTGRIRLVRPAARIIPLPVAEGRAATPRKAHNWQINEAVIIAVLAKHFGSEGFPLARKRCTKLTYLLHRHVEHQAEGYLKKAAGPYNPATRYRGPEGIAQKNGYVRQHHNGTYAGFVVANNIAEAEAYFQQWYGADVLAWLEQFRLKKTDYLELLATVDMAMEDLRREGKQVSLATVKQIIHDHPEWEAKLEREIFSDANITRAIAVCQTLFGN